MASISLGSAVQTVLSTLFEHHDLRLVALAALVCGLSAFAGLTLLHHARRTEGAMKFAWVGIAAISVGSGIWATHFIAMLSFSAGMPTGYDIPLTLLSLAIAIGPEGFADFMAVLSGPADPVSDIVELVKRPAPWERGYAAKS